MTNTLVSATIHTTGVGPVPTEGIDMAYRDLPSRVFTAGGKPHAATAHPEDAAAVLCVMETGATVKYRAQVVWREGSEVFASRDHSHDEVASVMIGRVGEG